MSASRVKQWWFALTSLPTRLGFRAGRASFVECAIARTTSELTPVLDPGGRPLGPKLLARHTLSCRPPRAGRPGWLLYEQRLIEPGPHRFAALDCAYCGHRYVIQIEAARGALTSAAAASYRCDWFRFAPSAFEEAASLACPRCETTAEPAVRHLHEP